MVNVERCLVFKHFLAVLKLILINSTFKRASIQGLHLWRELFNNPHLLGGSLIHPGCDWLFWLKYTSGAV